MSLKNLVFVTLSFLFLQTAVAQRYFQHSNHIGLSGGLAIFDIDTNNFVTEQGGGYMIAFNTRGAFYNNFDMIYGINFVQTNVGILGRNVTNAGSALQTQFIDYTLPSAQIKLLMSYRIIGDHLSIEAGPMLNVNGKMKLQRNGFDDYVLEGYTSLRAKDIENVSRVNGRLAAGITAGITNFRLSAQYQYGFTNVFNRLNDVEGIEKTTGTFEGNTSTILLMAQFYF